MKKYFLLLLSICWFHSIYAETDSIALSNDTLRICNYKTVTKLTYNTTSYPKQAGRFEPKAPGFVKKIIVTVNTTTNFTSGTFKVHVFGQEAGNPYPAMQNDLTTAVTVTKSKAGKENIEVVFPKPVWVDNNQFFICFSDISTGIFILHDNTLHPASCKSETGGEFFYTWLFDPTVPAGYSQWYPSDNAFAMDVIMDYPEIVSPKYFKDATMSTVKDSTMSNQVISWADINNDGYMDLIASGSLFKNKGDGTFEKINTTSGVPQYHWSGFIDMNNDGLMDIFNLSEGIYINNGNETFTKFKDTIFKFPTWISLTSWSVGDFNNDKYPDLFIGEWEDWKKNGTPVPNHVFINNGKNSFIDKTDMFYKPGDTVVTAPVRGSSFMDYNNDGKIDFYVSNYRLRLDEMWKGDGTGKFTDIIETSGIPSVVGFDYMNSKYDNGHGTGCDFGDFDNDGDMDLLLPQLAHPQWVIDPKQDHRPTTIYTNSGTPNYAYTDTYAGKGINNLGIQYEETHAGAHWGDVNNDGLLDFIIMTFYGCRFIDIYIQKPDHTFELKSWEWGIDKYCSASDAGFADYDNDGRLDLFTGNNGQLKVMKNDFPVKGGYVEIEVESSSCNKLGIGARVKVFSKGKQYMQDVTSGSGAFIQNPLRLFFGLPNWQIDSVQVWWPNQDYTHDTYKGLKYNNIYKLKEGGQIQMAINENSTSTNDVLINVYPNPFKDRVRFEYNLNTNSNVKIEIFSITGQKVKTLVNTKQSIGSHTAFWNGVNDQNDKLPKGLYFYNIVTDNTKKTGKLIIN